MNISAIVRFAKYVGEADENGCWPWTGAIASTGYGVLNVDGKIVGAHRLAVYFMTGDPIPKGMQVMHTCDNRKCVNHNHLKIGTARDNMKDMIAKGRDRHDGFIGEAHPGAKLSESDVKEILRLLSTGMSQREAAERFNVSKSTVKKIRAGESWAHVSESIQ